MELLNYLKIDLQASIYALRQLVKSILCFLVCKLTQNNTIQGLTFIFLPNLNLILLLTQTQHKSYIISNSFRFTLLNLQSQKFKIFQIVQRKAIKMNNSRFQYQLARDQQIQQLRSRCQQLFEENQTLKRSLEQLIKVNSELTESIEEFNNMNIGGNMQDNKSSNYKGQNAQDMQNKIDMLTMQVEMLRADVGGGNQGSNGNQGQDNEVIMSMVEEMLQSFKSVQIKYEKQIKDLRAQFKNYQSQWNNILMGIQNNSQQKFRSFDQVVQQLKRKDQIVAQIETKIKKIESSGELTTNASKVESSNSSQIKAIFDQQIQEKNRTIQAYKELIGKLKKKLAEKF